jgi:hypothetical protein
MGCIVLPIQSVVGFMVGDTQSLKKKYISFLNFFFSVTHANETFALLRLTWEIMWQRCIEIYLSLLQGLKRDINLSHGTIMWQFQTEQCLCITAIIF